MRPPRTSRDRPTSPRRRGAHVAELAVERALDEERASALGRAGERLDDAIATHRLLIEVGFATPEQIGAALAEVTAALYALVVQRDCVGLRHDNLGWILRHYDVPAEAVRRL